MPKSDSVLLPDVATLQLPIIGIPPVLAAASPRNLCRVAPDAKTSIQLRYWPRAVRAFIVFRNWLKFSQINCKCQSNWHLALLGMMPSGGVARHHSPEAIRLKCCRRPRWSEYERLNRRCSLFLQPCWIECHLIAPCVACSAQFFEVDCVGVCWLDATVVISCDDRVPQSR